nr:MMPL family transporter [uncultured Sphaerochaeta sp.]
MNRQIARSWIIIAVAILFTLICISSIGHLHIDSSTDAFIPQSHPVVATNERIEERFGALDSVVVSLYAPHSMVREEYLELLSVLTKKIEALDGVKQASSLTNLKHLEPSSDGVAVVSLYDGDRGRMEERIASWASFYEGTFISEDHRVLSILIQTTRKYNAGLLLSNLRELLVPLEGLEFSLLGLPAVTEEIERSLLSDLAVLAPIVALLIIMVLYLFLRRISAVLLSLVPLVFSSSLTLGIMAWTGITVTMATMLVPILLLIVGSAYTVHIFSHFYQEYDGKHMEETLQNVVHTNTYPIIGAAATTAFAFLAQLSSPLGPFRTFGLLSFIGVVACAGSSLILLPALIRIVYQVRVPRPQKVSKPQSVFLVRFTMRVSNKWGKLTITLFLLMIIIVLPLSYLSLQEGTNMLAFFRPSSNLVTMNNRYNQAMQGSFSLSVMITPPEGTATLSPEVLKTLEHAIQIIEEEPTVGGVQSILPFIKRMNQLLGPAEGGVLETTLDEPAFDFFSNPIPLEEPEGEPVEGTLAESGGKGSYEIPSDPALYGLSTEEELSHLIAQYLLLYSSSLDSFIDDPLEPDSTLFTILLKESHTETLRSISTMLPTLFPSTWTVEIGGGEAVSLALTDLVTRSQIISLFSSLIAVWILVLISLRSAKLATLALLPCLFALSSVFLAMALFSIKLDIVTSLVAALAIGIGVDYAIHLLSAFMRNRHSLEEIMMTTGKAILANAASVAVGFSGLLFSRFLPIANLGLLFCIAMISASSAALLLLVALQVHLPKLFDTSRRKS